MKISTRLALAILFFLCLKTGFSQSELPAGYYVVVAAYDDRREDFAKRYTDQLAGKSHNAQYGFNSARNLFFVYVGFFTDLKQSLVAMKEIRQKEEFPDAWVRVVSGNIVAKSSSLQESKPKSEPVAKTVSDPVVNQPVVSEKPAESGPVSSATVLEEKQEPQQPVVTEAIKEEEMPVEEGEKIVQYKQMTLGNTEVFLSLYYGTKNRVVEGEIQVVDAERSRFITKVKGNDYLLLPDPKSKTGQLTLTCEVFGYRKIQHELNYPLPLADTVKDYITLMGTTIVVEFDLVRYQKGDVNTLYNVYFYNDAAIMLPESRYELTNLLEMMQDSPTTKILLHGHSNGNYHGKILALGPEKNFFTMEGAVQSVGTAKDLSQQRAETIKEYLVVNGISGDRIEIRSWGGKRPLYDKHSVNAKKNVRVEVEVVEE